MGKWLSRGKPTLFLLLHCVNLGSEATFELMLVIGTEEQNMQFWRVKEDYIHEAMDKEDEHEKVVNTNFSSPLNN